MASGVPGTFTSRQKWLAGSVALAMLAAVLGTLLALGATRGFKTGYALPTAGSAVSTAPAGPLPPPVGKPLPRVVTPPPSSMAAPVPDAPAVDDEDADRIAGAIERTTIKALRRGESVHWHKAGQEGYVDVGNEQDDGDRVCRSVTAVILGDGAGEQTPSRTHLWCTESDDEDGDDWAPVQ